MRLARLNENGIAAFASWLHEIKDGGTSLPPTTILTATDTCQSLDAEIEVAQRSFASRYDAAEYLYGRIGSAGLQDIERDRGLWAWLSLFYIGAVCPLASDGTRKPGASARHIPEPGNFQRYYRHLLAGPFRIYRAHRDAPKRAMAVLCQPLDTPGDVVEQLASRQELITNRDVMGLATMLYFDPTTKRIRRGAGGKAGGSARRLTDVLDQFDLTWDLYSSTTDELLDVMPSEFSKFRG